MLWISPLNQKDIKLIHKPEKSELLNKSVFVFFGKHWTYNVHAPWKLDVITWLADKMWTEVTLPLLGWPTRPFGAILYSYTTCLFCTDAMIILQIMY